MSHEVFEIEKSTPFAKSLIWQLNRDYYNEEGIGAWRKGKVPLHMTSNSMVGKTYAELIFGFLKDIANKGQIKEKIYILELGAGHGRLAFHILKHLERLTEQPGLILPPYCYVLSDIIEDNLNFFVAHKQLQVYFKKGILDVSYFDAIGSVEIDLRVAGTKITAQDLQQPLIAIANYFFDSIPTDLFYFKGKTVSASSVALYADEIQSKQTAEKTIKKIKAVYQNSQQHAPFYDEEILNEIMEEYRESLKDSYVLLPHMGLQCIRNIQNISSKGVMVITMDKGFHELHDLENKSEPDMVAHGSFSLSVNYHAFISYCQKMNGTTLFPSFSTFQLEVGCLLFLEQGNSYVETRVAYQRSVNDFGPDDFTSIKKFAYKHFSKMNILEIIGFLRMGAYDSTLFKNALPFIKKQSKQITFNERTRLAETMHQTWAMYFTLNEAEDLAFEIGGLLYALGFYKDALVYFKHSTDQFGETTDVLYNRALCYYQLREDALFLETIKQGKSLFPTCENFLELDKLDLGAA